MGAALVLLLVGLGAMAAGVLIGRYYVPDDRQLRRTARHSRAYMRALSHLIARDHDTVVNELRGVVEENVDDVEPYFALGAMFRSKGEHERAIRVHQALAVRERDKRKLRQRAMYELGLDFRAAGMPRRATPRDGGGPARGAGARGRRCARSRRSTRSRRGSTRPPACGSGSAAGATRTPASASTTCSSPRRRPRSAATTSTPPSSSSRPRRSTHETAHFFAAAAELAAARGNHRGAKERLKQALRRRARARAAPAARAGRRRAGARRRARGRRAAKPR